MPDTPQKGISDMLTPKKLIALVCLLCFACVLLLPVTLLAFNVNHYSRGCAAPHTSREHSHSHAETDGICSICALIQKARHLPKAISAVFMGAPLTLAILFSSISFLFIIAYFYWSPVELSIRINC